MGRIIGGSVVLFVLAVGFVVLTAGGDLAALVNAFLAQPLLQEIAWAVIVVVPLLMVIFAVWLADTLGRERATGKALAARMEGVRQGVKDLSKAQASTESEIQQLTRSDPEDAIAALQRRVSEAERFAEVQRQRNETKDLESRVEEIRVHQEALKQRLAPVLERRRTIERLFVEIDTRQHDIEHTLAEIASGDDAVALDVRLKNLAEFVKQGNLRCDQIEQASTSLAGLNEAAKELAVRLAPFTAADDGVTARIRQLSEKHAILMAEIEGLERTPEGPLADRVEQFAASKKKLDGDVAQLGAQFAKLSGLRKDTAALVTAFEGALNVLALPGSDQGANLDARVDELSRFVEQTRSQFDDMERRVIIFGQLRTQLADLQSRLAPLDSEDSGVIKLIEDLQQRRESLVAKIRRIEGGEEGDLAARVKIFAEAKKELEVRVSALSDQFARLATIRKDIGGLFDKLTSAVNGSSN